MTLDINTLVALLTGVVVPLLLYLLSRGPQLRELKVSNDAANSAIERLERDRGTDRSPDYIGQLLRAHEENSRLVTRIAQLGTDLDIANRQIAELRATTRRPPSLPS